MTTKQLYQYLMAELARAENASSVLGYVHHLTLANSLKRSIQQ